MPASLEDNPLQFHRKAAHWNVRWIRTTICVLVKLHLFFCSALSLWIASIYCLLLWRCFKDRTRYPNNIFSLVKMFLVCDCFLCGRLHHAMLKSSIILSFGEGGKAKSLHQIPQSAIVMRNVFSHRLFLFVFILNLASSTLALTPDGELDPQIF